MADIVYPIPHHPEEQKIFWDHHGGLFTSLDIKVVRNLLTAAFMLLGIVIGYVGAFFINQHNLRTLRKKSETDRNVPLNHLTSWMSFNDTVKYAWSTHQLPGGRCLGVLMLLVGAFGYVNQYFVNSFIAHASVYTLCPFSQGIVTTHVSDGSPIVPVSTFSSAQTVHYGQNNAFLNCGLCGIYRIVNYTSTTFCPTQSDVLGYWNCSNSEPKTITSTNWENTTTLRSFLDNQGFLFSAAVANQTPVAVDSGSKNGEVLGFLAWSADQSENSPKHWNVRASVSINIDLNSSTAQVTNLECRLIRTNSSWTPPTMPSQSTLQEWVSVTYGYLMSPDSDYAYDIEWSLNAMVMLAGSGNKDRWPASSLPTGDDTKFGCVLQMANIRPHIWAMLGAMHLIFFLLILGSMNLPLYQYFQPEAFDGDRLTEAAPCNVQEWQLAFLKEAKGNVDIQATEMRDYSYGWNNDMKKYVIYKNNGQSAVTPVSGSEAATDHTPEDTRNGHV